VPAPTAAQLQELVQQIAEPERITWNASFDGLASISPNGKKMLFTRSLGGGFMSDLYTHVMDISALNIGPENYKGKR